ncbi:MAG: MBOAT family O-acyltransferase [Acidimicrobiia bacterium]|nr:MBOAT family O-acyltransferase [Acidimicrobiia bacterium]
MLFNSFDYLVFFVLVFIAYSLARTVRSQNVLLLGASLFFYGFGGVRFVALILICSLTAYFAAVTIEGRPQHARKATVVGIVVPLAILFVFKYFDFFIETFSGSLDAIGLSTSEITLRLALPIGISFFTFQSVGYVIDVRRGHTPAEHDLIDFLLFITFFPQLVAGPIERSHHLLPQLKKRRTIRDDDLGAGIFLIVQGLAKKILIADNMKPIVDTLFDLEGLSGPLIVAGLIGFTFQIYGDFSGYSDMARGSARLLGFDLLENFHRPYWSRNPSEFWRRWHISLSNWFRDYVYIGLGGNRRGPSRVLVNLFLTMVLSGLWHGASANFILWGAFHGALLLVHRMWRQARPAKDGQLPQAVARITMFAFTVYGWMLFRITEWDTITAYSRSLLTDFTQGSLALITLTTLAPYIALSIVIDVMESRFLPDGFGRIRVPIGFAGLTIAVLLFLTIIYGADSSGEFIYFKF